MQTEMLIGSKLAKGRGEAEPVINPKTGKRRNLGTFSSFESAKKHEREVQYFKRH